MKKKVRIIFAIFLLMLGIAFVFSSTYIFSKRDKKEKIKYKQEVFKTSEIENHEMNNQFDFLLKKYHHHNIIAFLDIPGVLKEAEPIVQAKDNDYYLSHNLEGKKDINGATFLDYRNNVFTDNKILIYGHSNSELSLPLSVIAKYADGDFFEDNKEIYLYTKEKIYVFTVFSSYVETDDFDYINLKNYNGLTWIEHLEKFKNKSEYKVNVPLKENKKVIILQTCSQEKKYKDYKRKYRLLFGIEE